MWNHLNHLCRHIGMETMYGKGHIQSFVVSPHLLTATSGSLRKVVYLFMCPLTFWDFWQWSNSLNLFWKVIHLISFYIVKSHWLNKECIIYLLVTQDCRVAWYLSDVHSHTAVCVLHCEPAIPPVQSESPCGQLSPKFIPVIKVYLQL